jgi:hypothetical protein
MSILRDFWNSVVGSGPSADPGAATQATMANPGDPSQVTVENPEIDPMDIEQNYQVDSATEDVLAKIARGEMTADEAMAEKAAEGATDVALETGTGEVASEGLLASAAPVAIPVAAAAAVFLIGEDSAVSDDEEKAKLAESNRQQAAREAATKGQSGDNQPAPNSQSTDGNQGPGDYEVPAGDSAPA